MRASAFSFDPKGVPSSKYPRRYHAPSQAWASIVFASWAARARQACASSPSSRSVEQLSEIFQHTNLKPGEPDAFAFATQVQRG